MTKQIRVNGVIHRFPDDATEDEINMALGGTQKTANEPPKPMDLSSFFKKGITQSLVNTLGDIGAQTTGAFGNEDYGRGVGQGVSQSILSGSSGIGKLTNLYDMPKPDLPLSDSIIQSLGQTVGQGAGYGAMTAPFVYGAGAIAPEVAGTLLPELIGAGTAGAAMSQPGERVSGALENAAPLALFKGLAPLVKYGTKGAKAYFSKVVPEETYKKIITQHNQISDRLSNIFNFVKNQAKERGINKIEGLDDDLFKNALEIGPKTKEYKTLVEKAQTGDYEQLRKLYSRADKYSRKAAKAENWEKQELFDEIKEMINDGLEEHFANTGHKDLSQWLGAAKSGWSQLKEMYGTENVIKKLVGPNKEIPKTLEPLTKNSTSMNRLMAAHPDVAKDLETLQTQEDFAKALKKAIGLAKSSGVLYLGSKLANPNQH